VGCQRIQGFSCKQRDCKGALRDSAQGSARAGRVGSFWRIRVLRGSGPGPRGSVTRIRGGMCLIPRASLDLGSNRNLEGNLRDGRNVWDPRRTSYHPIRNS
jgi:hypothetical protein